MDIMCTDNRFEIIGKAKKHLLEATNIDTSEDEMKVLDNFLFRCWQMGWLDRYDEQTEPSGYKMKPVEQTEPQTDGYMTAEQAEDYRKMLDKAEHKVYGNIEDEPQMVCKMPYEDCEDCETHLKAQYGDCNKCKWYGDKQVCGRCRSKNLYAPKDELQMERGRRVRNENR